MHKSETDDKPLLIVDKDDAVITDTGGLVIPKCRADYTLQEARNVIDDIMAILKRLDDVANLIPLYSTTKQLNRIFTIYPQLRIPLAKYLIECRFPALATKLIRQLNNIGVFTSDENDEYKHSGIRQTMEQMVSKGSPRNAAASALENSTPSSTTLTPLQSFESEAPSEYYDDYGPVASIPSTELDEHNQPEHPETDLESQRCHSPVPTRLSIENMMETTILDTLKIDHSVDVCNKRSQVLRKPSFPKVVVGERSMNGAVKKELSESATEPSNKMSPFEHSAKSRNESQKSENHLKANVSESQSVEMQTVEERLQYTATKEVISSKKTNELTFNSGRSAPANTRKSEIRASSKTGRTSDLLRSAQGPCILSSIIRAGPDNSQPSRASEKQSPPAYRSFRINHHMKENVRKVDMSLKDQEGEESSKRNENTLLSISRQNEPTNEEHRLKAYKTEESKSTLKPLSLISTVLVGLNNAGPINRETVHDPHTESIKDILPNIVASGAKPVFESNPESEFVLEEP
ncbi:hypothetical protein P879_06058 [Paragonimus westermani]|uniref:Uncharacterized protein n=1 Tax=Paragonimus westermani TaxID=34504 RepID=A0A8T0DE51_9TREM|nr:hypothetical protein P879_06058 [Paragonimus westermani]